VLWAGILEELSFRQPSAHLVAKERADIPFSPYSQNVIN
jgi:hypothetical protein